MSYNPFMKAISAASAELSSNAAQTYYRRRAQSDSQAVIEATLTAGIAVYEAAVFTFNLGAFCRAWLYATEQAAIPTPECTAIVVCASADLVAIEDEVIDAEIIEDEFFPTYLNAAVEVVPVNVEVLNGIRVAVACRNLIDSIAKTDAALALPAAKDRFSMTVKELRAAAKERGVKGANRMAKATLISLLA
jgi:hypothetical protein